MSTDSVKMHTGIPLYFSEIQYLLLETIPLETVMRVFLNPNASSADDTMAKSLLKHPSITFVTAKI